MTRASALAKFACPACGGEAVWNATRRQLVCAFCGTESALAAAPAPADDIEEYDLESALRDGVETVPEIGRITVACQSCRAVSLFEPGRVAERCQFCGAAALVPYEELGAQPRPESILPFLVSTTPRATRCASGTAAYGWRRTP